MGNRLRIAGTAEIGTRGMKLRDNALSTLIKVAGDWFPARPPTERRSSGSAPAPCCPTASAGARCHPIPNLYLNTGHGSTGWVMACGSGKVLADVVGGRHRRSISTG